MHFQNTRIKSLKKTFLTSEVEENVFLCICANFQTTRIKSLKNYFYSPLEWLKTCFDAFPDHQNQVLEKLFFNVWSGSKRVFKHFRILPDHQNQVIRKLFFFHLCSGYKRVLMHFLTTRIKSLKIYFFTSGVVKNVFYAFAHTSRPPESSP
jgi:hypothetical protein